MNGVLPACLVSFDSEQILYIHLSEFESPHFTWHRKLQNKRDRIIVPPRKYSVMTRGVANL